MLSECSAALWKSLPWKYKVSQMGSWTEPLKASQSLIANQSLSFFLFPPSSSCCNIYYQDLSL